MVIERARIRFLQQVPNDENYREYLRQQVNQFVEDDPDNWNLRNCVACVVKNAGHSSRADRRNHCTVDFYNLADDGGAEFVTTQHVPAVTVRTFINMQRRRRRN